MEWGNGLIEMDFTDESGINGHIRINHFECPGFAHWAGPLREIWDSLKYHAFPNYGNLIIDPKSLETLKFE